MKGFGAILTVFYIAGVFWTQAIRSDEPKGSFFKKSLHHTGEGMRYWYERPDGFKSITDIPYKDLGCKDCHIQTCDQCHLKMVDEEATFSTKKAQEMETCLVCHTREKLSFQLDKKQNRVDVHVAADMACADCHHGHDVHGDGTFYNSMRDPGAVEARCDGCHMSESSGAPVYDEDLLSHSVHGDKLDCAACHVQNTMACFNCHFSNFLKTKTKKGNFLATKDWMLLINFKDRVTSGTAMTLVHDEKTFVTYGPYFTHSVASKGRTCAECHDNEAVRKMAHGGKVPIAQFEDGKVTFWKGVIPTIHQYLEWQFLEKKDDQWIPIATEGEPAVQYSVYGKPLTLEQLEKLAQPMEEDEE